MKKTFAYFVLLIPLCFALGMLDSGLCAQTISAGLSKNRVAVNEIFQLEFTISNGNPDNFTPPANLRDFTILSGPNEGSQVQINNGRMSQSSSITYVLRSAKEGKFTIGPASIMTASGKKESNKLSLEVVKGGGAPAGQGNPGGNQANAQGNASGGNYSTDDNLFARTTVSRTKVYLGEQITVVNKIYTKLNLRGFQDVKFPSYNGFWSQDAPQKGQIALTMENLDGVNYNVAELKRTFIFPQRSGTLEIEPLDVTCVVRQRSRQAAQTPFDQFFGNAGFEDVVIKTKTKPIKIEVMPLPEANKPEDFSGAVGNFSFKATLSKNKVKTNEAINLSVSISGSGNLKLIDALKVNIPADIEKYDPKISDNVGVNATGVSGTKTFEYVLIPRHAGEFKIDRINFSYFNPEKKTFVSLPSSDFEITVEKGKDDENTASGVMYSLDKKDVSVVGNDIRYIKTASGELKSKDSGFFGTTGFYESLLSPVFLFAAFAMVRRKHLKDNSNMALVKSRKANRMARKRLEKAEKHMKENKKEDFYEEVFKALYGYLSDRLGIPFAELNKEGIGSILRAKNVSEETCSSLSAILDNCEFARYAPAAVSGNLSEAYASAAAIISKIEDQLS